MDILQECSGAKIIGISAHVRPDGDAIGSGMALYLFLKKKMPGAKIHWYLENIPDGFTHLPHLSEADTEYRKEEHFDVFFALDTNAERLGGAEEFFNCAVKKVHIDHHISNVPGCGDVNLVVPDASSTAEVLYGLIPKEDMDTEIATALYTGIIHDTGVFQYTNTSPKTMQIGAELIGYGFPFAQIIEESFYQKTYLQTQVLGRALIESIRFMDGQCIFSCMDQEKMAFYGARPSDMDGIVNQLRNIAGVHCAIFIYEKEHMEYKVSMRSDEYVDVAKVASFFGGGGHVRAAGCTIRGTMHDVINNLSGQIALQLGQ